MYVAYEPYLPPAPSAGVVVKKVNVFPQQKPSTRHSFPTEGLLVRDLRVVHRFNHNILVSDTPWYSSWAQTCLPPLHLSYLVNSLVLTTQHNTAETSAPFSYTINLPERWTSGKKK